MTCRVNSTQTLYFFLISFLNIFLITYIELKRIWVEGGDPFRVGNFSLEANNSIDCAYATQIPCPCQSLKFGDDLTSGCWDIPFLIFEVFFHYYIGGCLHLKLFFIVQFGRISLGLKFWEDWTSGCWDIPVLIFEVFFHYFFGGCLHLKLFFIVQFGQISLSLKFGEDWTSGCWDIPFLICEVFFHYFIGGCLHLKFFL